MKNLLSPILIILLFTVLWSCGTKDSVVAEAYHAKLYKSQVTNQIPDDCSPNDSIAIAQMIIDNWLHQQVIIHEAQKCLSFKEKNFSKELEEYQISLLTNAFYNHITSDSAQFIVTDQELNEFLAKNANRYTVNREIIKINYVKTSKRSKIISKIKELLFDEERRINEKSTIEQLCADSIEYFLEDNTWLYLDDIQNEFPIEIANKESILTQNKYVETEDNEYHYMLVFLDYKSKRSLNETDEEISAARSMLMQKKKQEYINKKIEKLYNEAFSSGKVTLSNHH